MNIPTKIKKYVSDKNDYLSKIIKFENNYSLKFKNNKITINTSSGSSIEGTYQILGVYNKNISTWYWAWSCPFFIKDEYSEIKKIQSYPNKLFKDKKDFDGMEFEKYDFYCSNNVFLASKENLKEILNLSLFFLQGINVFKFSFEENDCKYIQFIALTKINKI